MKKIFFTIVFITSINALFSQEDIRKGIPVEDLIPIKRESIELEKSNNLATNKVLESQNTETIQPTGSSEEVGVTKGELSVSLSGGAKYDIPFLVPPGIRNIEPKLSISYNSQSGNDIAGYGWNINGISSITRIPSTIYHDGINREVKFDILDRFALDGQRLLLKNQGDVYGGDGVEYQTENYSNLKITSYGTTAYGPQYFIVEFPDGTKAYYGNTPNSYSKSEWGITYMTDPLEVKVNYEYYNQDNKLFIKKIKYGAQGANAQINDIEFIYKNRNRVEKAYVNGEEVRITLILSEVKIKSNNVGFRNYVLEHNLTSLGYERLVKITEKTGDNSKSLNPTVFGYNDTSEQVMMNPNGTSLNMSNINYMTSSTITGDFDGDGNQDIILYPTAGTDARKKYYYFNNITTSGLNIGVEHNVGSFIDIMPINWLSLYGGNGKLMPDQGWVIIKKSNATTSFNCYSSGSTNPIYYQYNVNFDFPKAVFAYFKYPCGSLLKETNNTDSNIVIPEDPVDPNPTWVSIENEIPKTYINGDFNGDGLSDLIAIEKGVSFQYQNYCSTYTYNYPAGKTYFVNLDRRLTSGQVSYSGNISITDLSQIYVADFNGDQKSDLFIFEEGGVKIYTLNENNTFILLKNYSNSNISLTRPILLGDYNGDGKTDFIIPNDYGTNYSKFLSNGISFIKSSEVYSFYYYESAIYPGSGNTVDLSHLIPFDFNGDGKTDMVRVHNGANDYYGAISVEYHKNTGDGFVSGATSYIDYTPLIKQYAIPVVLNHDKANPNSELSFVTNGSIFNFRYNKSNTEDILLRNVTLGNGVKEKIYYSPLNSLCEDNLSCDTDYGANAYVEDFPNFDVLTSTQFKLVSKIEKESFNSFKTKEFKYFGAVTNFQGKGFQGFRAMANTDWFEENQTKINNVTKFDLNKRGAIRESYSVVGEFPNGFDFNSYSPTSFIQKSIYTYTDELLPNLVYKIKNDSSISYNGLNNTSKEVNSTYDQYNNLLTATTLYKSGTTVEKEELATIDYLPLETTPYYVLGKIDNENYSSTYNGDTFTSEIKYHYNPLNQISKIEKKGHLTNYITEDFNYDSFGNVEEKTVTAVGLTPRVYNYTYDSTGRFLLTSTDLEGLITTYNYDNSTGLLLSEELPSNSGYPLTTYYTYDKWGKMTKLTDYLGNETNYNYSWLNIAESGYYMVSAIGDDDSFSMAYYDDSDRKIIEAYRTINDASSSESNLSFKSYEYNIYNQIVKEYEPELALPDFSGLYTGIEYDLYKRPIKISEPGGKITTIIYNGLTTSTSDGVSNSSITKNSAGYIVSKTDNGGTINYQHYANGNLKQSTLGNVTLNLEQDGWGRRNKLIDPSAGEYIYEYNEFGETTRVITPKGETTYVLDDFGKLTEKTIIGSNGDPTNTKTTYTYNSTTKLLTNTRFDDFTGGFYTLYSFGYDNYKRLNFSDESGFNAYFQRATFFDSFGRPERELYAAVNTTDNKSSIRWVRNTYKNGFHWQILDNGTDYSAETNQVLWQSSKVDAKGHLIKGLYGNNVEVNNTYDQYGFPTQFKHDKLNGTSTSNLLTLNTEFDSERGNLNNRYNSMFDYQENFTYDDLDRLISSIKEDLINTFTFDTTTEGFLPTSSNVSLSLNTTIFTSKLRVTTTANFEGTQKLISSNANIGEIFKIEGEASLNVSKGQLTSNYIKYSIIERDPVTGNTNEVFYIGQNAFSFQHTVSQYSEIYLKIVAGDDFSTPSSIIFTVDNVKVSQVKTSSQTYDTLGRIDQNEIGTYNYTDNSKPYQNTSIDVNSESLDYYLTRNNLNVTYNAFKSPIDIIEEGKDKLSFIYNMNNGRSTMYYGSNDSDKLLRPFRKHYSIDGSMEIKQNIQNGTVEFITYIGGSAYSAPVVLKSDGTTQEYLYLHRDYLNSIVAITDQNANVIEKRIFDAWGNIIKVQDGNGNDLDKLTVLERGYTGHEHLQGVNLIHMNGRLYDPIVHRFLQPDNYIQDPYNTQNYNRYSYVLNNPLKYVDFSGEQTVDGVDQDGMTNTEQTALGSAISTLAANWDKWRIKDFFNDNVSNGFKDAGNWLTDNLKSVNGWFDRNLTSIGNDISDWLFGKEPEAKTIGVPQFNQVQSVNGWQNSGFQSSGVQNVESFSQQNHQPWDTNRDGVLQKSEADYWYLFGNGKEIYVDNRLINWNGLKIPSKLANGKNFAIKTTEAFMKLDYETAGTYGGTSFQKMNSYTARVLDQSYHYEMRPYNSFENIGRNILTKIGTPLGQDPHTGKPIYGQPYMIHYLNPIIVLW